MGGKGKAKKYGKEGHIQGMGCGKVRQRGRAGTNKEPRTMQARTCKNCSGGKSNVCK